MVKRVQKLDAAWAQAVATDYYGSFPPAGTSLFDLPRLLEPSVLEVTLTHAADTLPAGRAKLIHDAGSVTILRYVPKRHASHDGSGPVASGLLAEEHFVLARLSVGDLTAGRPFGPGVALKFFPDEGCAFPGPSTRNVVAVVSLEGFSGPRAFFEYPLTTSPPAPTSLPYEIVNHQAQVAVDAVCPRGNRNSLVYPLDNLCRVTRRGEPVASPADLERIEFWPTGQARKAYFRAIETGDEVDFRLKLATFPKGLHLYRVWGAPAGAATAHRAVGDLYLDEVPIACAYGDQTLFFQHQYRAIDDAP